jgi:lipopolysaccharide export system protein LptC
MLPFRRDCAATLRRSWKYLPILLLAISFSVAPVFAKSKTQKQKRKKARAAATVTPSGSPGEQSLTNIPIATGHEAKGVVLPDFDPDGNLRGRFEAGTVRRIDDGHVGFQDLKITTYTQDKQVDLQIDLQSSVLDLKTRILTSQDRATIKRADFQIVGDSVQFDTATRTGHLVGNVKMLISGQSALIEKKGE